MSDKLRNYTCADPTLESSTPLRTETMRIQNKDYTVNILLDMNAAKIWSVEGFISEEECRILHDHGLPRLRRATVAGEDGLATISQSRKAQQASYIPTGKGDPLW